MDVKVPFFVKHFSVYMATLEDCHSVWFDVLYVLKFIALFRNDSVDALHHVPHFTSYFMDSSSIFAEQLMM